MTIEPSRYIVGADTVVEDVDLEQEDVRLPDGRRLTNELADQLVLKGGMLLG